MDKLEKRLDSLLKEFYTNLTLGKSRIFLKMPYIKSLDDIYSSHLSNNQLSEENQLSCSKLYKNIIIK